MALVCNTSGRWESRQERRVGVNMVRLRMQVVRMYLSLEGFELILFLLAVILDLLLSFGASVFYSFCSVYKLFRKLVLHLSPSRLDFSDCETTAPRGRSVHSLAARNHYKFHWVGLRETHLSGQFSVLLALPSPGVNR